MPAITIPRQRNNLHTDPKALIHSRVTVSASGCWIWTRGRHGFGYGILRMGGKTVLAHRLSYETFVGPIPTDTELDHVCRTPACVNPEHLEAVSHRDNLRRSPVQPSTINAAKTHCKRGHAFTDANTYLQGGRMRVCRTCKAAASSESNDRRRTKRRMASCAK